MFCGLRVLLKRHKSSNKRSAAKLEVTPMASNAITDKIETVATVATTVDEMPDANIAAIDSTEVDQVAKKSIECQTFFDFIDYDENPSVSQYADGMYVSFDASFAGAALYDEFVAANESEDNAKAIVENIAIGNAVVPQRVSATMYKHPLQRVWTLWYFVNDRFKTWAEMQNEIASFDTVEDYWEVTQCVVPPSELKMFCQYSIFKQNIRPMWEDPANRNGGRWVLSVHKALTEDMDNIWQDVILCLIGEMFINMNEVCGAVVNRSYKSNKISIWTSNGCNEQAILEIGYKLREILRLTPRHVMHYQLHLDSIVVHGKHIKSTYMI